MGTILTSIQMFDGMTPGLNNITKALNTAIESFEALERVSSKCIDTNSVRMARSELNKTDTAIQQIQKSIQLADAQQQKLNQDVSAGLSGGTLGNTVASSGAQNANLSLGTGMKLPEQDAQTKSDKISSSVQTLTSVIPDGFASTDAMKDSMFSAADEIDAKFGKVSQVFGAVWSSAAGEQTKATQPLLSASDLLADNWSSMQPLVMGAAAAMDLYTLAMEAGNVATMAGKAAQVFQASTTLISTAFNGEWTASVFAQTAAQEGLNAAILTCPITWIILAVIALIAIFYAAVAAINKVTGSSISATGIIFGAFSVLGAGIYNIFAYLWNVIAIFVNFFANAFQNPIAAVKVLFYDLAINAINSLKKITDAMGGIYNKITGKELHLFDGLDAMVTDLEQKSQDVKDEAGFKDVMKTLDLKDYGVAFDGGYGRGEGLEDNVTGVFGGGGSTTDEMDQLLQNSADTAQNTSAMAESTEISQEDLKYLRDISERDAINRFTTAQVNVDFKNQATINSDMDIDGVMNKFTDVLREAIFTQAEEVHTLV